ncbi:MAG: FGGY family carbohydrate kinase [Segetibacter sp.]
MTAQKGYMIVDIGTGNVRVALASVTGEVLSIERDNVQYIKDEKYPEAQYFDPNQLWSQIEILTQKVLQNVPGLEIKAITASSQREGIIMLGKNGESLIGMPNHDHRGRQWESIIDDKSRVYELTGRYPSSLFSAMKLVGIRERHPELWEQLLTFTSISDWAQYKLCGVMGYEHSQASETLLYDIEQKSWSDELCTIFDIDEKILPPLHSSGTILGPVVNEYAAKFNIAPDALVIVGGADTQLAIKSTQPSLEDVVIVSGTTTPITKVIDEYTIDKKERTWTNRHIDDDTFILEANAGVTGLNYQRLKEIFYPNESYEVIENEIGSTDILHSQCIASLGSTIADEKTPLTKGAFIFNAPVSHLLTRADFVYATLWDIACSIKENYNTLCIVSPHTTDYVWVCGGGLQSPTLRQFVANLINKKVRIREGFQHASVVGGALICNETLGEKETASITLEETSPKDMDYSESLYEQWKSARAALRKI